MVCLSPAGYMVYNTTDIPQATNMPYQPLLIKTIFSVQADAEVFFTKLVEVFHFLNSCVNTPNSVEEYIIPKKAPSLTEFWKVSDDKPGYLNRM